MPSAIHLYEQFGATQYPLTSADASPTDYMFVDPAKQELLAFFEAAINAELGELSKDGNGVWQPTGVTSVWSMVTGALPSTHDLYGTRPIQMTLGDLPTRQVSLETPMVRPLLCLYRTDDWKFDRLSMTRGRLTQMWEGHIIFGPLDLGTKKKLDPVFQAIAKLLGFCCQWGFHPAYKSGALVAEGLLTSYWLKTCKTGQAKFAEDDKSAFYSMLLEIETTERTVDMPDAYPEFQGAFVDLNAGTGDELRQELVEVDTSQPLGDQP